MGFLGQMLHDILISVVRVSRKSSTIFLLNLCKIQRHMFIYLGFTSQRSLRLVQYNLNQNFAHSADLNVENKGGNPRDFILYVKLLILSF